MKRFDTYSKGQSVVLKRLIKSVHKKKNIGYCCLCEKKTVFVEYSDWLRDNYRCVRCRSIPRYRATINALNRFFAGWKDMSIHESSPGTISSAFIQMKCANYSISQYFPDVKLGAQSKDGVRCEDLTKMTFADNSFDLFITQDVFEHVFNAGKAFAEINRVLKPGGAHVFTMPWYPDLKRTVQRAEIADEVIRYLEEPVYHGNPVSKEGSLVVNDWGMDFVPFIEQHSGMDTMVFLNEDKSLGLKGRHLEVFISYKRDI
jgi:SAM-dependent methyltransferase